MMYNFVCKCSCFAVLLSAAHHVASFIGYLLLADWPTGNIRNHIPRKKNGLLLAYK